MFCYSFYVSSPCTVVEVATTRLGLDIIYGDTDSVMINTGLKDLAAVKAVGASVKKEVSNTEGVG